MMSVSNPTNPRYADTASGSVLLDVTITGMDGVHVYTASPNDVEETGRDLYARAISGEFGDIAAYVPPTEPEPLPVTSVTRAQAKVALYRSGLLTAVEAAVTAAGGEVAIWYTDALSWRRDNVYVASLAATLGLTTNQVDNLFTLAASIEA